jgi:hypothetical protein
MGIMLGMVVIPLPESNKLDSIFVGNILSYLRSFLKPQQQLELAAKLAVLNMNEEPSFNDHYRSEIENEGERSLNEE